MKKTIGFSIFELLVTVALALVVFSVVAASSHQAVIAWLTQKNQSELISSGSNAASRISDELAVANKNTFILTPCAADECLGNKLKFQIPIIDRADVVDTLLKPTGELKYGAYTGPTNTQGRQNAWLVYKVTPDKKLVRQILYDPAEEYCGNGTCGVGESDSSCSVDCGAAPACGDVGYDCVANCAICPACEPCCGDGSCNGVEDDISCPDDCGGGGSGGCFLINTLITMADGTQKPIQEIKPGDKVLSFDEETKKTVAGTVKKLLVHPRDTNEFLIINNHLFVTKIHPFYKDGGWIAIGKMKAGDVILKTDLIAEKIEDIKHVKSDKPFTDYNFEIEKYKTYFAGGYLVHNAINKNLNDGDVCYECFLDPCRPGCAAECHTCPPP